MSALASDRRRPARLRGQAWVWQVTGLSMVLGLMLALALRTTDQIKSSGLPSNRHGVSAADLSQYREQNEELQREVAQERDKLEQLRADDRQGKSSGKQLREELIAYRALLGFEAMGGPGLKITLRDSPRERLPDYDASGYMLTHRDITGLINELWAAGAEGIAVSGADGRRVERFVLRTSVQPMGRGVTVNGITLTPPYTIRVIGNPKELQGALRMPEGIVQALGLEVLQMIAVEEKQDIVLPAYRRSTPARIASEPRQ